MTILMDILAVSAIAAGLALLLVLAERFIANYGECEISINDDKKLTVKGGQSLLSSLTSNKVFIPSACGGRGTCGTCKCKVLDGAGPLLPTEEPLLEKDEIEDQVRICCQIKVRQDLRIEIPAELLSVREYQATCAEIIDLTHDIKQFRFDLVEPETIDFIPGQYIQLLTPKYEGNDEEVYRAYSISSDPSDKHAVELIIRLVPGGICTTYCFNHLKVGDPVRFNGPYGDFRLSDTDADMIFIAGGSGMAPMKCILHHMQNTGNTRRATYFFGANLVEELFYTDRMKQFEGDLESFQYVPVVAKPSENGQWQGQTGLVTEAVPRVFDDISQMEGYLCGSPGMIDASIAVLEELGMSKNKIYYDKFG